MLCYSCIVSQRYHKYNFLDYEKVPVIKSVSKLFKYVSPLIVMYVIRGTEFSKYTVNEEVLYKKLSYVDFRLNKSLKVLNKGKNSLN